MSLTFGPKLGLLTNANIDETYYDQFRQFLQAIDALVQASVLSSSVVVPPSNPNNGDAYILSSLPSGVWTGYQGYLAVWDTQVTTAGTNSQVPQWVFYYPQPGWLVWNVAAAGLYVYTGLTWAAIGGGVTPVSGGGTGATTAIAARGNLGASASGINSDITALNSITSAVSTSGQAGITVTSAGGNGDALVVTNGTQTSTLTTNGTMAISSLQANQLSSATASAPMSVVPNGGGVTNFVIAGTGTDAVSLLGFTTYPTRTVVGATGSASGLPTAPLGYLELSVNGTIVVVPYYTKA